MRILLDTNAYTFFAQSNGKPVERVEAADEVLMSTIVLGELFQGFRFGTRFRSNSDILARFLSAESVTVIDVSATTADWYSRIAAASRAKGRPIPTNDMWIAAHAMETGAELISADHHFEQVDGLGVDAGGAGMTVRRTNGARLAL